MKMDRHTYGINFKTWDESINLDNISTKNLFYIAHCRLFPLGGLFFGNKDTALTLMQRGVKVVEILRDPNNKLEFISDFFY